MKEILKISFSLIGINFVSIKGYFLWENIFKFLNVCFELKSFIVIRIFIIGGFFYLFK